MERAEGEALRLERESEAECIAQEQVIDISFVYLLCVSFRGMRDNVFAVIGVPTMSADQCYKYVVNVLY